MSVFNSTEPSSVFGDCCCGPEDEKSDGLEPVECIANLTLPVPPGVVVGTRFIVTNTSGSIHPTWINLPSGLSDGDIIEKDFQNLNWLLAVDVSECPYEGGGLIVWVNCMCYNYYYDSCGNVWKEISPCAFGGYEESQSLCVISNGQTNFQLNNVVRNADRTIFTINGQRQDYGVDYTISGSMLIWLNSLYELETDDCLEILYC